MKNTIFIFLAIFLAGTVLLTNCSTEDPEPQPEETAATDKPEDDRIARGAYLVNTIGCDDCHSPKVMGAHGPEVDQNLRLSGHPASQVLASVKDPQVLQDYVLFSMASTSATGPWGTSFAANITPDETGIGNWTEEQFLRSIREGKVKGLANGRPMLPPMPWTNYRSLSDEDLKAIFAYLKTLKPVRNLVPAPVTPAAG